ncbi:MAG: hypothetical protein CME25_16390 [Gemmatimonadetes bacterium]|nr:hypothetical protein [Gemmatimonadota bacterium]|tara:strand:+ start:915 stop:2396 length:1482 start_codon:yes stop_codon:yes gene_type:complete
MLSRFFIKKGGKLRLNPQNRALLKMAELNVSSANITLLRTADGEDTEKDLGKALLYKRNGRLMIQAKGLFITTPDATKAENQDHFQGEGEILRLWFLYERVPRVLECKVEERVRFTLDMLDNVDPKVGVGFRISPLADIVKHDKRSTLRFSHLPGRGALPVYPQVLFDACVWRTNLTFPTEGAITPQIDDLRLIPPENSHLPSGTELQLETLVKNFKEAMRGNPTEDRNVHVSKPFLEEKHNRSVLLELGYSEVLGLGSEEIGRNLYIKKPLSSRIKDRRDSHYLSVGDTLVLHYGARSQLDGRYSYYELVTEISKGGLENITILPQMAVRGEQGLQVGVVDFSVNGIRFDSTPNFLEYTLGENYPGLPLDERLDLLQNMVLLFNFYPRLRFNRDTDPYRPGLPKRISLLGRIVRSEIEWEDEEEQRGGLLKTFGVKFMYDPVEYSSNRYHYDRWEMIRPFKENRYFKEVHKSLNGLIAYLESQTKELEGTGR